MIFIIILSLFLKPTFPLVEYIVNYDYIVNVLCENKATPEMECNGKCHLMKELAKNADTEKPASSNKKNHISDTIDILFNPEKGYVITSVFISSNRSVNAAYANLYAYLKSDSTFHPPSFIS